MTPRRGLRSTLLIAVLWALSSWSAVQGAYLMPLPDHSPQMSSAMVATLLVLPVLFFGAILFEYFALPFVAGALLAAWPHLSGRAPYSFWLVATGVWLGGGVLAIILLEILHRLGLIHS